MPITTNGNRFVKLSRSKLCGVGMLQPSCTF